MILASISARGARVATPPVHPTNPILDLSRDDDWHDTWGTALSWFFPCAGVLDYLGEEVPASWGYRPSIAGSADDIADGSWSATEVLHALHLAAVEDHDDGPLVTLYPLELVDEDVLVFAAAAARHAGEVFARLLELVPDSDRY